MTIKSLFLSVSVALLFSSCATKKLQLRENSKNPLQSSSLEAVYSFYLVGNTGKNKSQTVLDALEQKIKDDKTEDKMLLFLGDNISAKEKEETKLKRQLDRQIEVVKNTGIAAKMVPGNYDWNFDGVKGLEVIEDYLEEKLSLDDVLAPNNGCPLESIEISDDIQLIIVDSQWYLEDWDKHPDFNDKCEIKSRKKFLLEVEGELKKNANKFILFATHHPLYTNGIHGGKFSGRDHLFPLGGNIPFPGVGTLITQIRSQGAPSIQDKFNKRYREYAAKLELLVEDPKLRVLLVSGHEQNLQYIENGHVKQLISGAGASAKASLLGYDGLFTYGRMGFAKVQLRLDGSVWVLFYASEAEATKTIFEKKIFDPIPDRNLEDLPTQFPKTMEASVYELEEVDKSDFFESFWGKHYREVYGIKVEAKVAVLDTLYGGLEVVRPGGGHQTKSLRLITKDGKEYNMRALRKSAVQFLESTAFKGIDADKYFSNTITETLITDFYTAAHPYAALAIPEIAKAAQVYYTTPQLYYVPKQVRLGNYNDEYGDQLYLIVERPTEEYKNQRSFGYPDDVESTDDLLEKIREDEDYTVDEVAYIRARIFDMLIGDWDRHEDQWRWAEFEDENGKKVFEPIPRDRDQVFANFDGKFLNTMKGVMGSIHQFGVYGPDIEDVKWFNKAGSKLDRALIKRSGKEVWIAQAKFLQENINDKVLDRAFAALPEAVKDGTLEEIKSHFIARKANLVSIVERYYQEFLKFQMLTGTDKDDFFEITRLPLGETRVVASRIQDGEKGDVIFDRTFNSAHTEELWLYGLDDDDVFEVKGKGKKPVVIRIVGGQDKDTYRIEEGRAIKVYDSNTKKSEIEEKGGAYFRFTDFYEANVYDYQKVRSKGGGLNAMVGFNPDDGLNLSAGIVKTVNNFIENPYGRRFEASAYYIFQTQGLDLRLEKAYAALFKDYNLVFNGRYTSRNYTENFFGYGNETNNLDDTFGIDFNRVNLEMYNGGIGLERLSDYGSYFQLKVDLESVEFVRNGTNFIASTSPMMLGERSYFITPNMTYRYKNFDDNYFTTKGMLFSAQLGGIDNLQNSDLTGFLKSTLQFFNALTQDQKMVLKTQVQTHLTAGDTPQFFQSPALGAWNNLRGFRRNRFIGNHSLVGSADILYEFEKIKTVFFPLQLSLYGGADVGRVWVKNDTSKKWHNSYGGGLRVSYVNTLMGTISAFNSEEGLQIQFQVGLTF